MIVLAHSNPFTPRVTDGSSDWFDSIPNHLSEINVVLNLLLNCRSEVRRPRRSVGITAQAQWNYVT